MRGGDYTMVEKNDLQKTGNDIVKSLEVFFKQAPHLPENIREILVKIAPWLALIFGILGVVGGLSALALSLGLSPLVALGGEVQTGVGLIIASALGLASSILTLMAYPKLAKHQYSGWMLLFWSELVSVVSVLLTLTTNGIVGAILGVLLGFYLLFEIKSYYK